MELRQLATFQSIAQTGSFTRAAERLGYVQSNVTAHIQGLEEELGVVLFDRLGRQIQLTESGRRLLKYADQMLALAAEARDAVSDKVSGEVLISAPETLCAHRLPTLLRRIRNELPGIHVVFRPLPSNELRQHVSNGTIDVALTLEQPRTGLGLNVEVMATEEVVVVAPPDHALTRASAVGPQDMDGEIMLQTEAGCPYRVVFEQALQEVGANPRETLEFSSVEAIKQCVMAGMGLAVLPKVTITRELRSRELAMLAWQGPSLDMSSQLVWHAKRRTGATLQAFLDLARKTLKRP
jgi:DNA-binding transcriptional LysR family regulator